MRILLDFDWTLFNTEQYKKEMGLENISCVEHSNRCLKILKEHGKAGMFLFPDTVDFLKNHSQHRLILVTFGDKKYQKAKVQQSGILNLFSESIFTGTEMKGDIIKRIFKHAEEKIIFLDDDFAQLQNMKKQCPHIVGIRMRRKEMKYGSDIKQTEFPEVSNLNEFAQLLASF
ncbi:MAG: hypothetical protein HYT93_01525 [Parcubacteria group bacterium]|nr:hypothetical protein [Parcubacteria group bacterium]